MNKFNRKEIIDGVTIIHTGWKMPVHDLNGQIFAHEIIKIYDADGNSFYSNFESIEEATIAIKRLAKEGITAVIGPKAPCINHITGEPISNQSINAVAVYIVKEAEKNNDYPTYVKKLNF